MEVQDSKEKNEQQDEKNFADKYIERRGLNTSRPVTSRIVELGYTKESNEQVARIKTPDLDFVVNIGDGTDPMKPNLVEFLADCPRDLINNDKELQDQRKFDSWLSDDLRRFGFTEDSRKYSITVDDLPEIEDKSQEIIEKVYPYYLYRRQSDQKPGVKRYIKDVEGVSETKFKLTSDLSKEMELTWTLDVPFEANIEEHPVARLIENQANGDPRNLKDNTEIYIVNRRDLVGKVHPLKFDETGQWALLSKEQYNLWKPHIYTHQIQYKQSTYLNAYAPYLLYILFGIGALLLFGTFELLL